jgi:hypothetical protein
MCEGRSRALARQYSPSAGALLAALVFAMAACRGRNDVRTTAPLQDPKLLVDANAAHQKVRADTPAARFPVSLVSAGLTAIAENRSPLELATSVSGRLVPGSSPLWWNVVVADDEISVAVETRADGRITEIGLHFDLRHQVRLAELPSILGPYEKVAESKTSSVGFYRPAPRIIGFAHLFSSRVLPGAVVTSLDLRLEQEGSSDAATR